MQVCVWINPYIAQESKLFDEGAEKGYFVKRGDGSVWQYDFWVSLILSSCFSLCLVADTHSYSKPEWLLSTSQTRRRASGISPNSRPWSTWA